MKKITVLAILIIFSAGCSDSTEPVKPELTEYNKSVISYFKEIALGFQFGGSSEITRKWKSDMKIFVGGNPTAGNLEDLENIRKEINELATDGFSIEVVNDSLQSNAYIYFGSHEGYSAIFPSSGSIAEANFGVFSVYWNENQEINYSHIFVDNDRADTIQQNRWFRKMLTGTIGLGKVSLTYPESIFQWKTNSNTVYSTIDKDLIRLLYHPEMTIGLDASQVEEVLESILLSE